MRRSADFPFPERGFPAAICAAKFGGSGGSPTAAVKTPATGAQPRISRRHRSGRSGPEVRAPGALAVAAAARRFLAPDPPDTGPRRPANSAVAAGSCASGTVDTGGVSDMLRKFEKLRENKGFEGSGAARRASSRGFAAARRRRRAAWHRKLGWCSRCGAAMCAPEGTARRGEGDAFQVAARGMGLARSKVRRRGDRGRASQERAR